MQKEKKVTKKITFSILLIILALGIQYRFIGIRWNQRTNLHPDEYGLTNTLNQLSLPENISDYFNTRISPISPYQKYDKTGNVIASGPDNWMRWGQWPMIIIRGVAEITGNTGYDEIRITGRYLSAIFDILTILLIFFAGKKLYGNIVGLLGSVLSSLTVMQIQQSHFMTVDNFAVFFSTLSMYAAIQISQYTLVKENRLSNKKAYRFDWRILNWFLIFSLGFGMAIASKINLIPLAGMVIVASFVSFSDLKLLNSRSLQSIICSLSVCLIIAFIFAIITFRICQPMAFREPTGDTSLFSFHLNQDWIHSIKLAQMESNGIGGGPPAEQWTDRPMIFFPLINMLLWGMGIPLGIFAWLCFLKATIDIFKHTQTWKSHLLPVVWVGSYFLFMATRWVKSMRYFLPIYPFLCLFASWGLVEIYKSVCFSNRRDFVSKISKISIVILIITILGGTLIWAHAFVKSTYEQDHTRIQATEWILQNIPAPIHIEINKGDEKFNIPISVPNGQIVTFNTQFIQSFTSQTSGTLTAVTLPHVSNTTEDQTIICLTISYDPQGQQVLDQSIIVVPYSQNERGVKVQGKFNGVKIEKGKEYYVTASILTQGEIKIYRNIIVNEDWDEGLPVPIDGYNPFGQFYQGSTMYVRGIDDENKRTMYYENLEKADYIIIPSQRALWSVCRLPLMYPMTLEYYRTLFSGDLGFNQVALFQAPIKIGALWISDIGGTFGWKTLPDLPLFNFNPLSAEEAFSVYDHPPVWIFEKKKISRFIMREVSSNQLT